VRQEKLMMSSSLLKNPWRKAMRHDSVFTTDRRG
jgi:hypothetical protein